MHGLSILRGSAPAKGRPRRLRMRIANGAVAGSSARRSTAGEDSQAASGGRKASAKPGPAWAATASRRNSG